MIRLLIVVLLTIADAKASLLIQNKNNIAEITKEKTDQNQIIYKKESIFFNAEDLKKIYKQRAIQNLLVQKDGKVSDGFLNINDRYYLNSILYVDNKQATIWINNNKYIFTGNTIDVDSSMKILETTKYNVKLLYKISSNMLNQNSKNWTKVFTKKISDHILTSATGDFYLDLKNMHIKFELTVNNSIDVNRLVRHDGKI